jgi:hypothetical protein
MEESGQLHFSALLASGEKLPLTTEWEAGWTSYKLGKLWVTGDKPRYLSHRSRILSTTPLLRALEFTEL